VSKKPYLATQQILQSMQLVILSNLKGLTTSPLLSAKQDNDVLKFAQQIQIRPKCTNFDRHQKHLGRDDIKLHLEKVAIVERDGSSVDYCWRMQKSLSISSSSKR